MKMGGEINLSGVVHEEAGGAQAQPKQGSGAGIGSRIVVCRVQITKI